MPKSLKCSFTNQRKMHILCLYAIIFSSIFSLTTIYCQDTCSKNAPIMDDICFNNLLMFKNKEYQEGNFAIDKNGNLIVEFYENDENEEVSSSRLFYGLKKDGKNR